MIARPVRSRVLVVALVWGVAGMPALAADPARPLRPSFPSEVEVVNLNVSVSDPRNQYVVGLAETDFTVLEDGVPQRLCHFNQEDMPISVALLLDGSHSIEPQLSSVKSAAIRLLRALRPHDEARVVHFNHRAMVAQDFTRDRAALELAVHALRADGATGLHNAIYSTLKEMRARRKVGELRRRAVVVLTDGTDTSSLVTDDQVLAAAKEGDVNVYTISLRPGPRRTTLPWADDLRGNHFLTALARDTGGQAYFPAALGDLDAVYDRIAAELRTQYALGYVSSNPRRDGSWRKIAIHLNRGSMLLRYRMGYFAPKGAARTARGG
jgi:Ca-activated chloride channel homolog